MDEAEILRRYKTDWASWHSSGLGLRHAARQLRPDIAERLAGLPNNRFVVAAIRAQELMLLAFALECYFKAALLVRDPAALENNPKSIYSHNLQRLAKDAGITATSMQSRVLETLQQFAEWRGRYPFPTDDRALEIGRRWEEGDDDVLDGLFSRAELIARP